jgi:hypothetical protein
MTKNDYIGTYQHQEHRDWLSQLDFYQDEIRIFQHELMQVLHRHPNYLSIIEHVDEYRRILLKKLEKIDEFRREIVLHEKRLSQTLDPTAEGLWDHSEVRNEIALFFKEFEAMKTNFRRFVAFNN